MEGDDGGGGEGGCGRGGGFGGGFRQRGDHLLQLHQAFLVLRLFFVLVLFLIVVVLLDDAADAREAFQLARELRSVIVLKGAYSSIALPDGRVIFNSSGNPGMAKGGCGDVLTGILTALTAQSYSAATAAQLGVFLHGFAGDLAAYEKGLHSMVATDLINFLPGAFKQAG